MSGNGPSLPLLIRIPDLPTADMPLNADDLLIVEQNGLAKKTPASAVLPGGNVTANHVYAGPATGAPGLPAFRLLVADDIPGTLNSTLIDGTLDAGALLVNGNSVLTSAIQGTITVYGDLTIGSGLTLSPGGTLTAGPSGDPGFTVEIMLTEYDTATQFGTFDFGPMPFDGTIDTGHGRAGPSGGTISVASLIGSNSGGTLTFGAIIGLNAFVLDGLQTIQTGTATSGNVFSGGDYLRAVWSQVSGASSGSLWSLRGTKTQ